MSEGSLDTQFSIPHQLPILAYLPFLGVDFQREACDLTVGGPGPGCDG